MKEYINNIFFNVSSDKGKFLIFLMFTIYPFIVIPNKYGYFYYPRFIFLLIVSLVSLPILLKMDKTVISKREIYLLLFITFMLISSFLAYDMHTAIWGLYGIQAIKANAIDNTLIFINTARLTGFITYIACIILYLLSCTIKNTEKLIKYMIFSCAIVSIIAIMQHFGYNIVPHESFRNNFPPYGTIGQHNFLATYTVFILPASILYAIKSKKNYWIAMTSIIFAGLLVSTTRGGWITFGVVLMIFLIYIMKHPELKKRFIIVVISMSIVTAILLPTNGGTLYNRLATVPENITAGVNLDNSAGSNRMYIWKEVIKQIPKYWVFGIGPDSLINAGIKLGNTIVDKAHNIYLEIFITMGAFTFVSYLLFLSTFIRKWKNETGFMYFLMIFTYLVQGLFNIDVIMVLPLFWIVLGLSAANVKV